MSGISGLRKSDIIDSEILDADELISDGYFQYYSGTTIISCTSSTRTVLVNPFLNLSLLDPESHIAENDRIKITGSSACDGYYTIEQILGQTAFTVAEPIANSVGGNLIFYYPAGALNIGFNPIGCNYVTAHNVQDAITQLDRAIVPPSSSGITADQHAELRQLIHLADGVGGPFEGFVTGAYREFTGSIIFPTKVTWYTDVTKARKIVEKLITYSVPFKVPVSITWNVYYNDGVNIVATATDTITNSGPFEVSRVRTITDYSVESGVITAEQHKSLRQLIHLAEGVGGPFETFPSGVYRENLPVGPFPTSIIWYIDATKLQKIVEKFITYNSSNMPSLITWRVYDTDGITVLHTVTDTVSYSNNVFEISRTRAIV